MENKDKLFDQIKTAAENAETKDFPSMENVWSRLENKLDKKVLKKENTLWKKIAVAAILLLVISIAYQYLTPTKNIITPKNETVTIDTTKSLQPQKNIEQQIVSTDAISNPIQENTTPTLQKPNVPNQIIINNNYNITSEKDKKVIITDSAIFTQQNKNTIGYQSKTTIPTRVFESRGVVYKEVEAASPSEELKKESQNDAKKLEPLVVIDDKVKSHASLISTQDYDVETLEVLPDPLYIINGVYYTEQELFGPKPTSPYAPLSQLEINTISILQGEKATAIYGEKGKKGVVIITTKTGKPSFKKP